MAIIICICWSMQRMGLHPIRPDAKYVTPAPIITDATRRTTLTNVLPMKMLLRSARSGGLGDDDYVFHRLHVLVEDALVS